MEAQERVKRTLDDVLEQAPMPLAAEEIESRLSDERSPYSSVLLQATAHAPSSPAYALFKSLPR